LTDDRWAIVAPATDEPCRAYSAISSSSFPGLLASRTIFTVFSVTKGRTERLTSGLQTDPLTGQAHDLSDLIIALQSTTAAQHLLPQLTLAFL
jgi:hypothetical protein